MATNLLAELSKEFVTGTTEITDVITFAESSWGLGITLSPVQKFILKCASGDNIIVSDNGVPTTLREYFKSNQSLVQTYDESTGKIRWASSNGVFETGQKRVFRLTGKLTSRWVELTGDHLVKTPVGYRRLDSLQKGDPFVISEREPFPICSSVLEPWQAGFLGMMVGDGSCSHANIGLVVADGEWEIRRYFEDCVLRMDANMVFRTRRGEGCETVFTGRKKGWDRNTKSSVGVFLQKYGLLGKNCHQKRVPSDVFTSSESVQREFLLGVFATDGGMSLLQGKKGSGVCLMYTSCNEDLIDDIGLILRRFGIRGQKVDTTAESNFGRHNSWQIRLTSVFEIRRFFDRVGVPLGWGRRYENVWKLIGNRKRSFTHTDKLPKEIQEICVQIRSLFRESGGKIPRSAPATIRSQTTGKSSMSALAQWTGDETARRISNSDICWDRVLSVEDRGEKDVYDISVPGTNNFVLNGVVVHNCLYGMPLDRGEKTIDVPDVINEHILYRFNEHEFLRWLYAEKRCNVEVTEGKIWQNLILAIGRRGGKSTLSACISNYEMYKLLKQGDPAKYYNHNPGAVVSILNVAPTDDQAAVVFDMSQNMAMRCPFIKDRMLHQTQTYFDLQTDEDIKLHGKKRASLLAISGGCSSNALRGQNAIVIILDEMAHFIDNNGRFSGSEVYNALEPSRLTFRRDGKVICISSPYAKFGKFYELWQDAFPNPEITLAFKMYSAMVNPTKCPTEILKAARKADRTKFMCEYGGEFSDTITAWIEDENEFKSCINLNISAPSRGVHDVPYYYGIDLGFKNDGSAVSIVHKDPATNKIVLDYSNVWYSGSSDVWDIDDSIYGLCNKFAKMDLIRMNDIVGEIKDLVKWFPAKEGIFDQHNGYALAELFQTEHLAQFEMVNFSDSLNSEVYQLVKRLYAEQLLVLFNHSVLVPEMLTLEAEKRSRDKTIVRAPVRRGAHDDISDSYCRAVWKCYNGFKERPSCISTGTGGRTIPGQSGKVETAASFMVNRLKKHGEHPRGLYGVGRRRSTMLR